MMFGKLLRAFIACAAVLLFANTAFACTSDEIDVLGDGTQCETTKFSVTTTNDATELKWTMTATGTFYVNCGDGGTLTQNTSYYGTLSGKTITRTSTDQTTYTCSWPSAGVHTVRFAGTATGYNTGTSAAISFYNTGTQSKVASVDGSLGQMFPVTNGNIPRFVQTFYECTNLSSIPAGLFSSINTSSATNTSYMFYQTFYGCSGLTGIPAGLFSGIDTSSATNTSYMFNNTFYGCTGLTGAIPAGLFSGIDTSSATNTISMFYNTFYNCTGLTGAIPTGLFSTINTSSATNTSYMFTQTFFGCTNLSSIPADLFSGIDTSSATDTTYMFSNTFSGCTNLSGYIPPTAFPSTITPGSSSSSNMWYRTFYNTKLATSCASYPGTAQYITGFESDWASNGNGGRVSCGCPVGQYGDSVTCTACSNKPANSAYSATSITATCPWTCDDGYYADNDACIGNIITINWSGASQADIEANDAGSVTYGGDIRTPRAATTVPGKIFRGWKFSKPSGN